MRSKRFAKDCAPRVMVFDLPQRKSQLTELETQAEDPDLWNDSENAQDIMRQLSAGRAFVLPFDSLDKRAADLLELVEMAQAGKRRKYGQRNRQRVCSTR